MSTAASINPSSDGPNRRSRLKPFLEALDNGLLQIEPSANLEPWEQSALQDIDGAISWHLVIREAHGWRAMVEQHTNTPDQTQPVPSTLTEDAIVGYTIAHDMQHEVDSLILQGDMRTAKRITQYKNRFTKEIENLEQWIGSETLTQCKSQGRNLAESARAATRALEASLDTPKEPDEFTEEERAILNRANHLEALLEGKSSAMQSVTQARFEKSYGSARALPMDTEKQRSLMPYLIGTIVVLAVIWVIRVGVPMFTTPPLPEADYSQLKHPAITSVTPRSPTVYITVDQAAWKALDETSKSSLVDTARQVLEPHGFQGALFRTEDGTTVGQWLKKTGSKTIDSGPKS